MPVKFIGRSRRVWAALMLVLGALLPALGLDFAPRLIEQLPRLEQLGNELLTTIGGLFALWSAVRPDGAKLTLPQGRYARSIFVLLLAQSLGCATSVQLWPPEVAVAIGDSYAGVAEDCSPAETDCSLARGGKLSEQGQKVLGDTMSFVINSARIVVTGTATPGN